MKTQTSVISADLSHLDELLAIESMCFQSDRLSKRSFKHWIKHENGVFLVAIVDAKVVGYGLVISHPGTSLARLYSLAIVPPFQGKGIAIRLVETLEQKSVEAGRLYMRLEVAKKNVHAIDLYKRMGYREFGEYTDYYDDHDDALRMQKSIWQNKVLRLKNPLPWFSQTTDFTCGPAALMMAMANYGSREQLNQNTELDIWRKATTIFMTSGHGGTHPFGLALAAKERGFAVKVRVSDNAPLFVDSVRSDHKKSVMTAVHNTFSEQLSQAKIPLEYTAPTQDWIEQHLQGGYSVIILISTYQLDKRKAPHWVAVTHIDKDFIYVHDPDVGEQQTPLDCQHVPIARARFDTLCAFGKSKLRTAIALKRA
ncbi:GNAT family N-acetyltransferase [Alteromonas sediminis]|uniref:GNAT family N-acetyltransferase n=1 Tax=Alteromonas sediminis TaxID=2259342 RepID=A0A3N5Z5Y3_9ALTE|nr:peptidase C39 family protein [Alteromonas sediminis]RPJ65814.1 GNAT family N-acetyltransferase [Alteromonas sediminis]